MKRHGAKANMKDAEGESTSKTARWDSYRPFYLPHCESDVTLVVEDKKLHVHKAVLSVHSPVFRIMLKEDFDETGEAKAVIELPGKKYDVMLQFLLMIYPVHSLDPITDDDVLVNMLPLAKEYQVQHVRIKCETYIGNQLRSRHVKPLFADKLLLYLLLCQQYRIGETLHKLIGCCAELELDDIENSEIFNKLTPTTQIQLLKRRCRVVENERQRIKKEVLTVCTNNAHPSNKTCYKCHTKLTKTCKSCLQNIWKD